MADADNYYTKAQVDEKLEDIVESGCCITPSEVDEKISAATSGFTTEEYVDSALSGKQDTLIAGDNITIVGNVISSVGSGSTDLSDYYTKEDIDEMLYDHATKTWVLNQNFVTNSELLQYISNLQEQINSLIASVSGCCTQSGETLYRWITMTGENDYVCSGTTKYTEEKKQQSTDNGVTWTDVSPKETRRGDTVLEENCADCGYIPTNLKFSGVLRNGNTVEIQCNSSTTLTSGETHSTKSYTSIEIGDCVTTIGEKAFIEQIYINGITIPSGVTTVESMAFADVGNYASNFTLTLNEGLVTIGNGAFYGTKSYSTLVIPNSVTRIGSAAFELNNISALTIGSGITSIGNGAFAKSTSSVRYETITILATTPPTLEGWNVFFDGGNCPIYVPTASVNAYKSANDWSEYVDRIQAIQ